ncbi:MAG TPA: serine/threonine-protein kinase [Mycobacteriales bacterium]|nr:serine/threonine-protein kinase [Mycobacteriales bacterium]
MVVDAEGRLVAERYRLLERLGSGGMGTVWRAEDVLLGREVAVKEVTFPPGLSDEEQEVLRERTRREARSAARIDHPSAVTVFDVAEQDGSPYLVMELVEARTLASVVRTDGPLTPQRTAAVGIAVLGALEAAHAEGIVHRDVKPGNVLLREDGRVVLTDFGIATFTGDSSLTGTGLLLGSPSYIAPERARGLSPGPESDLWSLGATLFTAVEGRPPYDAGEPLPTLTAVVTGDHAPYVAAGPLIPVLDGLLAKEPAERMDAAQARELLAEIVRDEGATMAVPAAQPAPEAERRADRTSALPMGAVRGDVAAVEAQQERQAEARPGPRRRAGMPVAAMTAVALAIAGLIGYGITQQVRDKDLGAGNGSNRSDDSPAPAPDGWRAISGSPGWKVAVPPSYATSTFDGRPQYKDEKTGRTLRVDTRNPGIPDVVGDRRTQAAGFARTHKDYKELSIEKVDYRDYPTADWEFTYRSGRATLHALSRVFVVDGLGYSLYFQTRSSDDWAAARRDFDQIAATFQPAAKT